MSGVDTKCTLITERPNYWLDRNQLVGKILTFIFLLNILRKTIMTILKLYYQKGFYLLFKTLRKQAKEKDILAYYFTDQTFIGKRWLLNI